MLGVDDIRSAQFGLEFWLRRWYRSPLSYVIEHLGETPTHQQACILKAFERHHFVAVASGHGIGKTRLEGWLAHWWMDTRGKRCPITGASADQLDGNVWPEIVAINGRKWPFISSRYESTSEELRCKISAVSKEFHRIIKRTSRIENPDALQGFHDCLFIIEEASGVPDPIFEVAIGAFGDPGNFGLMIGNPTRTSGYMHRVFHNKRTHWYCMSFSSEASLFERTYRYSYVDPFGDVQWIETRGRQTLAWIDMCRAEFGESSNAYRIRVKGEFANLGLDLVIPEALTAGVWGGELHKEENVRRSMGVDVGGEGEDGDPSAIVIREGKNIIFAEEFIGDPTEVKERAKHWQSEFNCKRILVDAIGIGAGVYSELWRDLPDVDVIGVKVSEKAPSYGMGKAECDILRSWLWWQSRQYYKAFTVRYSGTPSHPALKKLREELSCPTYKLRNGKVFVETKDEMKKRGLKSPNLADAHNLTFFGDDSMFDILTRVRPPDRHRKKKRQKSWKTA